MSDCLIYHNPACGTSRNVLAFMRQAGVEPEVVEYLSAPPSTEVLRQLLTAAGLSVRELLRVKGTPYAELGLDSPHWSDDALHGFIQQHPILMNRPLVVTPAGVRLCRPSERVLDLLPVPAGTVFHKEDGERVLAPGAPK